MSWICQELTKHRSEHSPLQHDKPNAKRQTPNYSKETDHQQISRRHQTAPVTSTGASKDVELNPAGVIKLMANKLRFPAMPAFARIRLIWKNWGKMFQCRIGLRFNRPE